MYNVSSYIFRPICKKNKGYTLLSKMGWKEGETLGKRSEGSILEPVSNLSNTRI